MAGTNVNIIKYEVNKDCQRIDSVDLDMELADSITVNGAELAPAENLDRMIEEALNAWKSEHSYIEIQPIELDSHKVISGYYTYHSSGFMFLNGKGEPIAAYLVADIDDTMYHAGYNVYLQKCLSVEYSGETEPEEQNKPIYNVVFNENVGTGKYLGGYESIRIPYIFDED